MIVEKVDSWEYVSSLASQNAWKYAAGKFRAVFCLFAAGSGLVSAFALTIIAQWSLKGWINANDAYTLLRMLAKVKNQFLFTRNEIIGALFNFLYIKVLHLSVRCCCFQYSEIWMQVNNVNNVNNKIIWNHDNSLQH